MSTVWSTAEDKQDYTFKGNEYERTAEETFYLGNAP